nr:uncharacterized protein LOC104118475 isoform X1 [Nicotiana tomentosiformis]
MTPQLQNISYPRLLLTLPKQYHLSSRPSPVRQRQKRVWTLHRLLLKEKIELELSQSTVDESEILPNDAVGKVLGKEHSGRVRCLGLGAVPGRDFRQTRHRYSDLNASSYNNGSCSSQWQEKYNQMLNAHNQIQENYREMMNAFKAYMIMKEGRIPEEFAGIFVSPPHSTVRKVHNFLI